MFEDLIRKLKKMEKGMTIEVPIEADEDDYLDKECPSKECQTQFKIFQEDWKNLVRDEEMYCPICGHGAPADQWFTTEQVEKIKKIGLATVERELGKALKSSAAKFNRRQPKGAFISMTMTYKGRPRSIPLPPIAAEPMKLKIKCGKCKCRYAVIGSGFFCPACGHNSAEETFIQSMQKIRDSVNSLDNIRKALDKDNAERMVRMILEKGIDTGVMSFQRVAEVLYSKFPGQPTIRRNGFQSLGQGSDLWERATGKGYDNLVTSSELSDLRIMFQQRHLFSHREGMVDADYIKNSGDTRYAEGQRISVKREGVVQFIDLLEKLVEGMKQGSPL